MLNICKVTFMPLLRLLIIAVFLIGLLPQRLEAACAANNRIWESRFNSDWNTKQNWSPQNAPDTNIENAYIQSDINTPVWPANSYTLSCFEISSGAMNANVQQTLTLEGDYFRNLNSGGLNASNNWEVIMAGTGYQSFENVDPIPRLQISNATMTSLRGSFSITNRLQINSGSGEVEIYDQVILDTTASDLTIPNGSTFTIKSGGTFRCLKNITVNGILKIEANER